MAKITTLEQALKVIRQLREEKEALLLKAVGKRSDGTIDKYTDMESGELRPLVIKRGGDPDEIVKGLHSRQRSIAMREWLRANPAKGEKATATNKKPAKPAKPAKPEPAPVRKPKRQPEPAAPARKPKKPAVVEAPARKPKKPAKPAPVAVKPKKKPRSV